jgi:hypothetical protein
LFFSIEREVKERKAKVGMSVRTSEEGRGPSGGYVTIEEFLRWKKEFQELKARYEEKERLIGRFWKERAVYIAIIVGSISILLTIIMMLIR